MRLRDKQEMYGHLTCKDCGQKYSSPINSQSTFLFRATCTKLIEVDLSAAVDVYCEYVSNNLLVLALSEEREGRS